MSTTGDGTTHTIVVYVLWAPRHSREVLLTAQEQRWIREAVAKIDRVGVDRPLVTLTHLDEGEGLEALAGEFGNLLGQSLSIEEIERQSYPAWVGDQWNIPVLSTITASGLPAQTMVCVLEADDGTNQMNRGPAGELYRYVVEFDPTLLFRGKVVTRIQLMTG